MGSEGAGLVPTATHGDDHSLLQMSKPMNPKGMGGPGLVATGGPRDGLPWMLQR
jgi:hypothetical protein